MARCCGGSGNQTKIEAARHVEVTGTGRATDPFVIEVQTELVTDDNERFRLTLHGEGTLASPWVLGVEYADSHRLTDLPDVEAEAPSNGYVLGYDEANERWVAAPPVTAPPGALVTTDGVVGDGSAGLPLGAEGDSSRFIVVTSGGIGLSDSGINHLIRQFDNVAARDAANPAVFSRTIVNLDSDPTRLWRYNGVDYDLISGGMSSDVEGQFLSLSGAYAGGEVVAYARQLATSTDGTGAFVAIPASDLAEYSGVLSVSVTPTGSGVAWTPMVKSGAGVVSGVARRVADGTTLAGANITAMVSALLY